VQSSLSAEKMHELGFL